QTWNSSCANANAPAFGARGVGWGWQTGGHARTVLRAPSPAATVPAAGGWSWTGSVMASGLAVSGRRGGRVPPGRFDPTPPAGGRQGPWRPPPAGGGHGSGTCPAGRSGASGGKPPGIAQVVDLTND